MLSRKVDARVPVPKLDKVLDLDRTYTQPVTKLVALLSGKKLQFWKAVWLLFTLLLEFLITIDLRAYAVIMRCSINRFVFITLLYPAKLSFVHQLLYTCCTCTLYYIHVELIIIKNSTIESVVCEDWMCLECEKNESYAVPNVWHFLFNYFLVRPRLRILSTASAFSLIADKASLSRLHVRWPS